MGVVAARRERATKSDLVEGVYLQDGRSLWQVIDAAYGHVRLENAKHPEHKPWFPVAELLRQGMKVVR